MTKRLFLGSCVAAALVAAASTGCGGDTMGSTGGSGGSGGGGANACGADIDTSGCGKVVAPGSDDTTTVQTALIEVQSNSSVCLCPGTYQFKQQLSLTVPNVTVKGLGKANTDTVLDFSTHTGTTNDTMLVTADGFTIENLWVKNTPGNGVVVRQSDKPTFRNLKVSWDSPQSATHGAYAVYPAECTNVLIEDCEVEGAADAAIYVGQGTGAIVRRNKAHDSVLGIELENTTNGEVYDNDVYNNSGGLAVFLLANLTKKTAEKNLLHDNKVHDNNHANFGDSTTFVASVPKGTGIIVVGSDDTEIRNNTIENNQSAAIMVVSYLLMEVLVPGAMANPETDPYPDRTYIHDNTFTGNGLMPASPISIIGATPLENVLWDGIVRSMMPTTDADAKFCLGTKAPFASFRMFAGDHLMDPDMGKALQSTDTTPYQCELPALPSSSN
ncbi:MAG: parallel beta-helix domain-containing protein [Minicystis sp.]